jgi:hypothetical protein
MPGAIGTQEKSTPLLNRLPRRWLPRRIKLLAEGRVTEGGWEGARPERSRARAAQPATIDRRVERWARSDQSHSARSARGPAAICCQSWQTHEQKERGASRGAAERARRKSDHSRATCEKQRAEMRAASKRRRAYDSCASVQPTNHPSTSVLYTCDTHNVCRVMPGAIGTQKKSAPLLNRLPRSADHFV